MAKFRSIEEQRCYIEETKNIHIQTASILTDDYIRSQYCALIDAHFNKWKHILTAAPEKSVEDLENARVNVTFTQLLQDPKH